jgi:hypothetical protein
MQITPDCIIWIQEMKTMFSEIPFDFLRQNLDKALSKPSVINA